MTDPLLTLYVVYDHPRDHPEMFVVRRQVTMRDGGVVPDGDALGFTTLEAARKHCLELGLTCLARHPDDDPVIVETWL